MNSEKLTALKRDRYLPGPGIINRYWIKGSLRTETPLHIGTGEIRRSWKSRPGQKSSGDNCNYVVLEQEGTDGGEAREGSGEHEGRPRAFPLIPGTSLRGVLRGFLEGVLYPFNTPGRHDVASLSSTEFDADRGLTPERLTQRRAELRLAARDIKTDDARQRFVEDGLARYLREEGDLVGFLFGTTTLRGRVSFGNARAREKTRTVEEAQRWFQIHTGVSIDRDSGAAAQGKLFDVELVGAGREFAVELRLTNARYWELGMLLLALSAFNHGEFPLHLGGLTQHGYGRMRWALDEIYQLGSDVPGAAGLADWLGGSDAAGAPTSRLAIGRRKLPGIDSAKKFEKQCIDDFLRVMDHVRA